jgi:hypothetical protein
LGSFLAQFKGTLVRVLLTQHPGQSPILFLQAGQAKRPDEATVICLRDTVVFSVVAHEWPAVKRHLEFTPAGN